jgi:hypothetical protein
MDEIECQKIDGKKKGLQKSRYLVARAKASKQKGRKEEKYQLNRVGLFHWYFAKV